MSMPWGCNTLMVLSARQLDLGGTGEEVSFAVSCVRDFGDIGDAR